jgi:hypothetical protein
VLDKEIEKDSVRATKHERHIQRRREIDIETD